MSIGDEIDARFAGLFSIAELDGVYSEVQIARVDLALATENIESIREVLERKQASLLLSGDIYGSNKDLREASARETLKEYHDKLSLARQIQRDRQHRYDMAMLELDRIKTKIDIARIHLTT